MNFTSHISLCTPFIVMHSVISLRLLLSLSFIYRNLSPFLPPLSIDFSLHVSSSLSLSVRLSICFFHLSPFLASFIYRYPSFLFISLSLSVYLLVLPLFLFIPLPSPPPPVCLSVFPHVSSSLSFIYRYPSFLFISLLFSLFMHQFPSSPSLSHLFIYRFLLSCVFISLTSFPTRLSIACLLSSLSLSISVSPMPLHLPHTLLSIGILHLSPSPSLSPPLIHRYLPMLLRLPHTLCPRAVTLTFPPHS